MADKASPFETSSWAIELPAFDESAAARARAHQEQLTKPPGSLGRLEELAVFYAGARGQFPVAPPSRARICVFAADHGVTVEGVSPYPQSVTAAMVSNFVAGGAAISVLARANDIELRVVDVGVASGATANLRREPAMTRSQASAAIDRGWKEAALAADEGVELLGAGEMGIGNTTAAAAVVCALTLKDPELVVGRGTGVDVCKK